MELRALGVHVVLVYLEEQQCHSGGLLNCCPLPCVPPSPGRLYLISHQEESLFESKADHSLDAFTGLHLPWSVAMRHRQGQSRATREPSSTQALWGQESWSRSQRKRRGW